MNKQCYVLKIESILLVILSCASVLGLGSCAPMDKPKPQKTQLQIREFQTKNFEELDIKVVMKSALNVLQDDGYVIRNVNLEMGFLNATKELDIEKSEDRFWANMANLNNHSAPTWDKLNMIECTINVTTINGQSRVRANFQSKKMNNLGNVVKVKQVEDPLFYQEFFSKMDKGIFLQKNHL